MIEKIIKDFKPIAVRDDYHGKAVISYNIETQEFLLSVSGKLMDPINLKEITILRDNLNDVLEMRGRYHFIKEYDVKGNKLDDTP